MSNVEIIMFFYYIPFSSFKHYHKIYDDRVTKSPVQHAGRSGRHPLYG